jgi:Ca2+-binding RTX toxin-like protein
MAIINGQSNIFYENLHGLNDEENIITGGTNVTIQRLSGGNLNDQIFGASISDKQRLASAEGDDLIVGGDYVFDQRIAGGSGNDTIYGGDVVEIQGLYAGTGNDEVLGGDDVGTQTIDGGADNDSIEGGNFVGTQRITGGAGDDTIYGGEYVDSQRIFGGSGDDHIFAGTGDTIEVYGQEGNDLIHGNDGYSYISAGNGNDFIFDSDAESDYITGGADLDTLSLVYTTEGVVAIVNDTNEVETNFGDVYANIEKFYLTNFDDVIITDAGKQFIKGNAGNDIISAGASSDIIWGGSGSDTFIYTSISDSLVELPGVAGDDSVVQDKIVDFETGIDTIYIDSSIAASIDDVTISTIVDTLGRDLWELTVTGNDFSVRVFEEITLDDVFVDVA